MSQPLKTVIKFKTEKELQTKMVNALKNVIHTLETQKSSRIWLVRQSHGYSWCVELKEGGKIFTLSQRRYFEDKAKAEAYALKMNKKEAKANEN